MSCIQNRIEEAHVEKSVFVKFWTNDVVWREILSYLNLTDLKYLSCVNKDLNFKVRSLSRLKSLFGQTFRKFLFSDIKTAKICRAVIEVDGIYEHCLDDFIAESLNDVEYLELQGLNGDRISTQTRNARLIRIFSGCTKLKSLAFGMKNLFGVELDAFFADDGVKTVFRNLKEFTIGVYNKRYMDEKHYAEFLESDSDGESNLPELSDFLWERIRQVSVNEYERRRLHAFELLENLQMKLSKFTCTESKKNSVLLQMKVLASSEHTLVELHLTNFSKALDGLEGKIFPNLAKFSVITYDPNSHGNPDYTDVLKNNLIPFLQKHITSLTDFSLSANYNYSLLPFCNILKASKKITRLKFTTGESFTHSLEKIDWSFLQGFITLRSFTLKMEYDEEFDYSDNSEEEDDDDENNAVRIPQIPRRTRCDDWARYFLALPSAVKSVTFEGFQHKNESDVTSVATTSFARFENLTELKMTKCGNFLNDETLQFICSKLTKLTVFVGEFDVVTDFGISGRMKCGTESGISIKNWKGLKELRIEGRADSDGRTKLLITWDGLLRSVEFLELVQLELEGSLQDTHYDGDDSDSKDGAAYHQLIRQNPSLERIYLAFYTPKYWFSQEVPNINSRIKLRYYD